MKIFFIMALGRSGTHFFASLLAKSPNALVYHEPMPEDQIYFGLRNRGNFNLVLDSYLERRFQKLLPPKDSCQIYGEVNSYLRCEIDWLKKRFDPVLIHLVRDGRDFVRSAFTREIYTLNAKNIVVPPDDDPDAGQWDTWNRFQKLCWYWKHTNESLGSKIEKTVRFEQLITDYRYFDENILKPTGLDIGFDLWKREVKKPKNTSKSRIMKQKIRAVVLARGKNQRIKPIPHWTQWDQKQIHQFDEICSETMKKFGYM
jgi:hypothetical protein